MSLTESIVRIVEEQATVHGFGRVTLVRLEIGELSHVDPDAIEFCFSAITKGSPVASGARLEIIRTPGEATCDDCGTRFAAKRRYDPCPKCGSHRLTLSAGEEMRIKDLEVE